jgi:hypothetical protein
VLRITLSTRTAFESYRWRGSRLCPRRGMARAFAQTSVDTRAELKEDEPAQTSYEQTVGEVCQSIGGPRFNLAGVNLGYRCGESNSDVPRGLRGFDPFGLRLRECYTAPVLRAHSGSAFSKA